MRPSLFSENIRRVKCILLGACRNPFARLRTTPAATTTIAAATGRSIRAGVTAAATGIATAVTTTTSASATGLGASDGVPFNLALVLVCH